MAGGSRDSGAVHGSNLKVVSPVGMVTYPDLLVRCGELPDEATEGTDPVMIIEVPVAQHARRRSGAQVVGYRAIPSVRHPV
jgi:hypothetical protein